MMNDEAISLDVPDDKSHLQAANDPAPSVRHHITEPLNLLGAGLLHGVLEVNVLTEANLLRRKGGLAQAAELVTLILKAPDHTRRPLHSTAWHNTAT
jgi:hypothetical protein